MASRPITIPQLDTTKTNRVAPPAGKISSGYVLSDLYPASNANYLHGWAGDWFEWLQERSEDGATPSTDFTLRGLDALTATGNGGVMTIKGGDGGSTSGNGGDIVLLPGSVVSGTAGRLGIGQAPVWADVEIAGQAGGGTDLALFTGNQPTGYSEIGFMSYNAPNFFSEWYVGASGYQNSTNPGDFYLTHNRDIAGTAIQRQVLVINDDDTINWTGGIRTDIILKCDNNIAAYNEVGFLSEVGGSSYASWWVGAQGYQATVNPGTFFVFHGKNIAGGSVNSTPLYIGNDDKIGLGNDCTSPFGTVHIKSGISGAASIPANQDDLIVEHDGAGGICIVGPDSSSDSILAFRNASGGNSAYVAYDYDNSIMTVGTADTNAVWIGSNQYVSIGIAIADSRLHVWSGDAGTVSAVGSTVATFENNGDCYVSLLGPDANEKAIFFGEPASNIAGSIIYNDASTPDGFQFRVNNNQTAMSIASTKNVTVLASLSASAVVTNDNGLTGVGDGTGYGVRGTAGSGSVSAGVYGAGHATTSNAGVRGLGGGTNGIGVWGDGKGSGHGVYGSSASGGSGAGVYGNSSGTGAGVYGDGNGAYPGVEGASGATAGAIGVKGTSSAGIGMSGTGGGAYQGVLGTGGSSSGTGIKGTGGATNGLGVEGVGTGSGSGVKGTGGSSSGNGVEGIGGSTNGYGVKGTGAGTGGGVYGYHGSSGPGLVGESVSGYGARIEGNSTRAPLRLVPQTSAPSSGSEGDIYMNSTDHKLYVHNGSTFVVVGSQTA